MRIIVYEHMSGGGYAQRLISPSVLCEGFGMLRCIVSDFKVAGHDVTVLLDDRISKLNPPIDAAYTVPIFYHSESKGFLKNIAKINDAFYVIAPETDAAMQSLVELAEATGKVSLNCESSVIAKVSDKAALYETLQKLGLAPKTLTFDNNKGVATAKRVIKTEFVYPIVIKPVDGVSCAGLSIINEERQVEKALAKIEAESHSKRFIAQEFIKGEAASVSLLCTGKKAIAISLNRQNIKIAAPEMDSSYEGGTVPFDHPLKEMALTAAERVVATFAGLRGYVGVDVVLAEKRVFVVDVNARLTTSYVGLRDVAGFNVAEALVNAVMNGKLPSGRPNKGYACFSKLETPKPTIEAFQKSTELAEVKSPPFPLTNKTKVCALISTHGDNLRGASERLQDAKDRLLNIVSRGKQFG